MPGKRLFGTPIFILFGGGGPAPPLSSRLRPPPLFKFLDPPLATTWHKIYMLCLRVFFGLRVFFHINPYISQIRWHNDCPTLCLMKLSSDYHMVILSGTMLHTPDGIMIPHNELAALICINTSQSADLPTCKGQKSYSGWEWRVPKAL